jgi:hypothetical protein
MIALAVCLNVGMTAADNRLAHFCAIVEREASQFPGTDKQRYRAAYRAVATAAGLSEEYVYQLFKGKKAKVGDDVASRLDHAYADGRPRGWIDTPPNGHASEPHASYASIRPPTTDEAVEKVAELLLGLDEVGREMASTALSNLARNPKSAERVAKTLESLLQIHPREVEPEPEPPAPGRKRERATATTTPGGKARLTVTAGGGKKVQMALPFKTVADPWDTSQAPANERAWYAKVKGAPKATGGSKK